MNFSHVDTWIFDLDHTLYPPEAGLFAQIGEKMNAYVMRHLNIGADEADLMRRDYWHRYGSTFAGMMAEQKIDPSHYLADVHDIDFSVLQPAPELAAAISALPGRKFIHTNGDSAYALKVVAACGFEPFEAIYGMEETGFHPKPKREAYDSVLTLAGIDPTRAAFFEDDPRNLLIPEELGMRTVLIGPGRDGPNSAGSAVIGPHVHYRTDDLAAFLRSVVG